jgi:hypothetical protein
MPPDEMGVRAALSDAQILALTLWAEARGEGRDGLIAVAWVIRNRVENPGWWGKSYRGVCLKPKMFSCWNPGTDPNHERLLGQARRLLDGGELDPKLVTCRTVAADVMGSPGPKTPTALGTPDPTGGSDHYFAPKAMVPPGSCPSWAWDALTKQPKPPRRIIGGHWFYRLGLDGKGDPHEARPTGPAV